jgi:hypothetical protein
MRQITYDCIFLIIVIILSFILYISMLGFYSDQWAFVGLMSLSQDQSILGLFRAIYDENSRQRPVEMLYYASLYKISGTVPLGYHLINSAMLIAMVVLFYLVLVELDQPRLFALAVPVVYGLLPSYSTDRFWSFKNNFSMALFFLALYADLATVQARSWRAVLWKGLALLSLLGSTLANEVALPLFLLSPALVWYRAHRAQHALRHGGYGFVRVCWLASLVSGIVVLAGVVVFKAVSTSRLGEWTFADRTPWILRRAISFSHGEYDAGFNVKRALEVHYGEYVFGLPGLVMKIIQSWPDGRIIGLGCLLGLVIFGYLVRLRDKSREVRADRLGFLVLLVAGLLVFALGYAIFLTNTNVQLSATGLGNRTAIAAAAGVALSLVGGIGMISTLLPMRRVRHYVFCLMIGLTCSGSFIAVNTIAAFWIEAYRREQAVLIGIHEHFPVLEPETTLLLDGICPYAGPATVFESSWDLWGALLLLYRDDSLRADVVTPRLTIEENHIVTTIYDVREVYPYYKLVIYNYEQKAVYPIADAEAARRYFREVSSAGGECPEGHEGFGVRIFRLAQVVNPNPAVT